MFFKMKGWEMTRLSFFVKFLTNLSPCAPAYGILQNITSNIFQNIFLYLGDRSFFSVFL